MNKLRGEAFQGASARKVRATKPCYTHNLTILPNLKGETEIKTELELAQWLKDNCYSMNAYGINGNFITEGHGIENNKGLYQWYYTERGEKRVLAHFSTEKEAVQYALKAIKADKHANRHYIGMYKSDKEVEKILAELKQRGIKYWTDSIPYGGLNDYRTRIFVIGCGIKMAADLIQNEEKQPSATNKNKLWSKLKKWWP